MNELTAGDIWRLHEQLERDASAILGRAIFAFSRLDANLGLMVASVLRVAGKVEQESKADGMNFHKRLEFILKYACEAPDIDPSARAELTRWVKAADETRTQRNQLVHGRWDVDPYRRKALNTVGLANSDEQRTFEYSLEELESFVQRVNDLQSQLTKVRMRWHLP